MNKAKATNYRGFSIISGDPTAPIDYPYRIGDRTFLPPHYVGTNPDSHGLRERIKELKAIYFKSISEAKKEIDKTWEESFPSLST